MIDGFMRFTPRPGRLSLDQATQLAGKWLDQPVLVSEMQGGFSNSNYRVHLGAKMGVLRVVAQGWESCQREAWLFKLALSKGISVPEVCNWRVFTPYPSKSRAFSAQLETCSHLPPIRDGC